MTVEASRILSTWSSVRRFGLDYARLEGKDGKTIDAVVRLGQPARFQNHGSAFVEVLSGLRAGDRLVQP